MTLQDVLNVLMLFVIGIVAYVLILKVIDFEPSSKRKRLSKVLNDSEAERKTIRSRYPFLNYLVPSYVMEQAEQYHKPYTRQMYVTYFITGTVIGIIAFFVYFKAFLTLIPLSLLGGVVATVIKLHTIKRDYIQETDHHLSVYMSSLTTAYGTFGNLKGAISSILPSLEEPLKSRLEKAYLILSEGKTPKQAFHDFNKAYPQKIVLLFHDQIQVIEDSGSSDTSRLREVANQMKKKEVFKQRLAMVYRSQFKIWRTLCLLMFSIPFMFILISYDNFLAIQNNAVSNIIMFIALIYVLFIYTRLAKIEIYDPTDS